MDIEVLFLSSLSCSNLSFMIFIADFTGMEVKRAKTSYEMMHSPFSNLFFLISSANSLELLAWWMVLPEVSGFWPIPLVPDKSQRPCLKQWALGGVLLVYFGKPL